ncbi:MAG: hypothetical protein J6B28_02790 [Eubacterium sp.]|nr:hypothetical protein [Eubacterium sp.]
MENNLIQVVLASLKAKITPLVTKFRQYTSANFIRTKIVAKIRDFFVALFDIRPKHKKDYYEIFGWLVSKKLAYAVVIIIGVLSLIYLISIRSMYMPQNQEAGIKTYNYDDIMLRFAKGKVRILGESGYLAYEGNVEKGGVNGYGALFAPDGTLLYQGVFANNEYEGAGTQYYAEGTMHYKGNFSGNLYEGNGKLYRENGTISYEGEFARGMKEGFGKLYNSGDKIVYEGSFSKDELVYSALLEKSTAEVSESYKGARTIYQMGDEFVVLLSDINAIYTGVTNEENLEDTVMVDSVYVLSDRIKMGNQECTKIADLKAAFGEPIYEGNSIVNLAEAIAINYLNKQKQTLYGTVSMETVEQYTDSLLVSSVDRSYGVYLYSFRKDGLLYTFVCGDRDGTFAFYSIMSEEGGE